MIEQIGRLWFSESVVNSLQTGFILNSCILISYRITDLNSLIQFFTYFRNL